MKRKFLLVRQGFRRKSIPDKYKMGRSSTVPYIENESWNERHKRRLQAAMERREEIDSLCKLIEWKFYIRNNGHHWLFVTKNRKDIEWFPSSGKLSIGKNWRNAIHVHDVDQLIEVITTCMEEEQNVSAKSKRLR